MDTGPNYLAASLVVPGIMLSDEATGETPNQCLLVQVASSSAAACSAPGLPAGGVLSGWDDFLSFSAVVPAATDHVVAATSRGTQLVGLPFDGIATVWWLEGEGDLVEVVAATPDGDVLLYP